jgi:peptide/nickel transport system permease protein
MLRSLATRIAQILATLWLATSAVFVMIHLSGDPTQGFLPPGVSPELREAMRSKLGLDDPVWQQYSKFVGRGFIGDFGTSWRDNQPALDSVLARLPATIELATVAIVLAVVTGIGYAILVNRPGRIRHFLNLLPSIGQAVPTFWLGAMLMMLFAVRLGWLPSSGSGSPAAIVLPALTLALHPASTIARLLATSMDDVAHADYVRTARSKGLPQAHIVRSHIAPNALLPAIGYIGLQAGFLIGGTVIVESLFAWPGIGRLALQSAIQRDLPVIHAFVAVTAVGVILVNIVTDILQMLIDPRLRSRTAVQRG